MTPDASTWATIIEPGIGLAAAGAAWLRKRGQHAGVLEEILQELKRIVGDHEGRIRLLEAKH